MKQSAWLLRLHVANVGIRDLKPSDSLRSVSTFSESIDLLLTVGVKHSIGLQSCALMIIGSLFYGAVDLHPDQFARVRQKQPPLT